MGECRSANCARHFENDVQMLRILGHNFDKCSCTSVKMKFNGNFFAKRCASATFRLGKKFGEIDPWRRKGKCL